MPEGPTIRHTADLLRAALEGQQITRFHSPLKKAAAEGWAEKIVGQSVRAVRAHGKNLFIDFANDWTLYTHMLMWGAWHIYAQGEPWRREARKSRVVLARPCDHVDGRVAPAYGELRIQQGTMLDRQGYRDE